MGKPKAPKPPDYSAVAAASEKAAELSYKLGQEQLAWAKEQYASDKGIYDRIVDGFLSDMDYNSSIAKQDREFYEQHFQPLEEDLAREAASYDTQERREKEMGSAQSAVAQQFSAQRENAQRELEAYGIDPSSTRYAALDVGMRAAEAAAAAAAGTGASNRVEDTARALRSEAINVGRGYPGQVAQSYQTASQQGGGAAGITGQGTQIGGQTMGTAPQYMGLGNQAVGTWGNTLNMGYQNQLDAWKANQQASSGIGGILGLISGFRFEDGGAVPPVEGGAIPEEMSPSGGEQVDDIPARLNAGEFVIPDDAVSWYGEKHFYSLIQKAQQDRERMKQETGAVPQVGALPEEEPVFRTA